jgi:glycosyltransferase involved in cell wall biosynthesis
MRRMLVTFGGTSGDYYYLYGLCSELSESPMTIVLAGYMDKKYVNSLESLQNVERCIKLRVPKSLVLFLLQFINPKFYVDLFKLKVEAKKFDLVHFINEFRVPALIVKVISKEIPVICTIHEPITRIDSFWRKTILNKLGDYNTKKIAKYATMIIVHGPDHKKIFMMNGIDLHKMFIIPHGQFKFYASGDEVKNVFKFQEEYILFFGKLETYKGVEYLISAAKLVHQKLPALRVVIAGKGNYKNIYPLVNGEDYICILNKYISDDEAILLFSKTLAVVMPYTNGSQSGIISMAAGFKKPVIASDVGHFHEMIIHGETGLLVPPCDVDALAMAIEQLCSNNDLRTWLGINAKNYMGAKFSWKIVAEMTREVYQEAIQITKKA